MADWLQPTIVLFPFAAWIFWGLGIPWALALLPRDLWRERVTVLAVGMALGPLAFTAWLFVIGTWGRITLNGTLAGSAALAALGAALAARRFYGARAADGGARFARAAGDLGQPVEATLAPPAPRPDEVEKTSGARAERGLVAGIALVLLVTTVVTAYWPFIAYDTQWVYGYNARIFLLDKRIPDDMGYYPQLLPLSYTTMQQAWHEFDDAAFNDHAARVVIPWFNLALVLMAYVLGKHVFHSHRVGLLTAAIWTFYPHAAAWMGSGDLEIPLTLYTTGTAAFFIAAWQTDRLDLSVVSGVLLGGALWTKPTGGALALGIMLAVAVWLVIVRFDRAQWWPKFKLAAAAGIASVPLGGMWYLRNLALGHDPVVFPASYWHGFAQRSGQEFGWWVLIALLVAGALFIVPRRADRWRWLSLVAAGLLLLGVLPTAFDLDRIAEGNTIWLWIRGDVFAARRLTILEGVLIAAGSLLLGWRAYPAWRRWSPMRRVTVLVIWALLLPYAIVWFFDFSYHYRLSFAIVPLFAVQVAALIDGWLWDWLVSGRLRRMLAGASLIVFVGAAVFAGAEHTIDAWRDGVKGDRAKYDRGNPGLMVVVQALERYAAEHGDPVVMIPGEDRLPFFFPTWDIRNSRASADLPMRTEDLDGVDLYVTNSVEMFLAQLADKWPNSLSAEVAVSRRYHDIKALGWDASPWPTVLEPIPIGPHGTIPYDDGNFMYAIFTIHPEARALPMRPGVTREDTVLFGDFARFVGYDVGNLRWVAGQDIVVTLYWQPTENAPPPGRYSIYLHLLTPDGGMIAQWDGEPLQGRYPTWFWRSGESLMDYWVLHIPEDAAPGPAHLRLGLYDPLTGDRLPVNVDGAIVGDGLTIDDRLVVE